MKSLSPVNTNYLLEVSLEQLHSESTTWLSQIDFWRVELGFFQRLLERVAARMPTEEDKKRIDHFQNLIFYFKGELLDELRHNVREHEQYLGYQLDQRAPFNEQIYRQVHKKYEAKMDAFERDYRDYKRDLYRFAGKFL
ncbi:hypothetical protein [Pontibacter anaerobius]|uniref:Uncharacterized protein n=1 Tax=Pontibacter anaerobius TaxID=2993940 RepID=A0ABT3RC36_9BACT|nr:hypothetical protein [Pontibacter anaerobius]MCX2738996.1 hypothetical protein [Pontibacter anaerobius]